MLIDDDNLCIDDVCVVGMVSYDLIDGVLCEFDGQSGICAMGECVLEGCIFVDGGWSDYVFEFCDVFCGGGT